MGAKREERCGDLVEEPAAAFQAHRRAVPGLGLGLAVDLRGPQTGAAVALDNFDGFHQARLGGRSENPLKITPFLWRDLPLMNADADLIERLSRSDLYTELKHAFRASAGLPLRLRPLEFWNLAHRGQPHENPFCALLAQTSRGCAAYLQTEQRAAEAAQERSATVRCEAGLSHTAVPVKLGERTLGFLLTGQVALEAPAAAGLDALARQLSAVANQVALREAQAEPPLVRRTKAYIAGHQADRVKLEEVAQTMHVSPFYFCKTSL